MKLMVKKTVGHFRVLLDHCRRRREPSPEHVLERMVNPLCDDFSRVLLKGTKNDAWQMIEGLVTECQKFKGKGSS